MEITVESITGRRTKLTNISPLETIRGLKIRIWKADGVPVAQQSLVYRSQELVDERTLQDYQMTDGTVIKLILITRSGPVNRRIELPKKQELCASATTPRNLSSTNNSQRLESPSSSSTIKRYTRQQMRQVQMTSTPMMGRNGCFPRSGDQSNSDVDQTSSLVDMTFTPERQLASMRRADENLRTMQRMRELRRSIERLNLEKSQHNPQRYLQQQQRSGTTSAITFDSGPSRIRRPTGGNIMAATLANTVSGSSALAQRSRTAIQTSAQSNERHSAAARAAYAADDTSAKESSAGETEFEDATCFRQRTGSNSCIIAKQPITSSACPVSKCKSQSSNPSAIRLQVIPPAGFKSRHQLYRNIRRSSCSDVDVESSAMWSSDADADGILNDDHSHEELYTADDLSLDEDDWCMMEARQEGLEQAIAVVDGIDDFERGIVDNAANVDDEPSNLVDEYVAAENGVSFGNSMPRGHNGQDISSDPSELSSGVVICELSMASSSRRVKVKRKSYHTPRHSNKRPQTASVSAMRCATAAIDETDDQSPLESPVKCVGFYDNGRPGQRSFHNTSYRDHHHLHAGYFPGTSGFMAYGAGSRFHRGRPRSKQRLPIASATMTSNVGDHEMTNCSNANGQLANHSTTTGDSSSDEHENAGRRDSQGNNAGPSSLNTVVNSGRSTIYGHKQPQSSQSQQRCNACACRLSIATTFQCRCGKTVCLRHRHADLHACTLLTAPAVSEKK